MCLLSAICLRAKEINSQQVFISMHMQVCSQVPSSSSQASGPWSHFIEDITASTQECECAEEAWNPVTLQYHCSLLKLIK